MEEGTYTMELILTLINSFISTWRSQLMYGIAVHVVTVPLTAHCLFIRTTTPITMAVSVDNCCKSWLSKEKAGFLP